MDQGTLAESESFVAAVKQSPGSFLSSRGYTLEQVKTSDSALETTVIYSSDVAKIAMYHSSREQEVNCMVAGRHAPSEHIEKPAWNYLTRVLLDSGILTRAELYARTRGPLKGWDVQLKEVADELTANLHIVESTRKSIAA